MAKNVFGIKQKAIFGVKAKTAKGTVFLVGLAKDKKTPISPVFSITPKKFKGLKKIAIVVEPK